MDFRKLSVAIIVIGAIIASLGVIYYGQNNPLPLPEVRSTTDMLTASQAQLTNFERAERQRAAQKMIVGGIVVIVIGGVILYAAKPAGKGS